VQGNMNKAETTPSGFEQVRAHYATNSNVVFLRPDNFFQLLNASSHPADHKVFSGDFNGDKMTDTLFYYGGDGTWWMGLSDGTAIAWHSAGVLAGGDVLDGKHDFFIGDVTGDGKSDVLLYS